STLLATFALTLAYRCWVWSAHDLGQLPRVWSPQDAAHLSRGYYWCYALPGRVFEFVLGMTAALAIARHPHRLTRPWRRCYLAGLLGCAALGVAVSVHWSRFHPVADVIWGIAFFSLLMYAGARHEAGAPVLAARPLVGLGAISYSIYLIHAPLLKQL